MLIVRGTKKLRDRIASPAARVDDESTNELGDWLATALFWRPQVAMLVNRRTMIPVFMPLAPTATLLNRVPAAIAAVLRQHGADEAFVNAELEAMREVRIAPTNDRSLLGVMNEFALFGRLQMYRVNGYEALSLSVAQTPVGPLLKRTVAPDRELALVLGLDRTTTGGAATSPMGDGRTDESAAASTDTPSRVYRLKVTLKGSRPPIWRRLLVDGSATLAEVHEIIQAAFGWWNYHLYEFEVGRTRYGIPDPDWDLGPAAFDAHEAKLSEVAVQGATIQYTYDFGDWWDHSILVESIDVGSPEVQLPACIDGRRAGPPEDCGGIHGYEQLLEVLADPTHEAHAYLAEWAAPWGGAALNPAAFDPADFNDNLKGIRARQPTNLPD